MNVIGGIDAVIGWPRREANLLPRNRGPARYDAPMKTEAEHLDELSEALSLLEEAHTPVERAVAATTDT